MSRRNPRLASLFLVTYGFALCHIFTSKIHLNYISDWWQSEDESAVAPAVARNNDKGAASDYMSLIKSTSSYASSINTALPLKIESDNESAKIDSSKHDDDPTRIYPDVPYIFFGNSNIFAEYEVLLEQTLKSLPGANSTSYDKTFFSGLCNQLHRFIGVAILAVEEGFDEIVVESITWKDNFDRNIYLPHKMLWDVVHWNSFFPTLPRFASYNKDLHPDLVTRILDNFTIDGKEHITKEVLYDVNWDIFNKSFTTRPPPLGANPQQANNRYRQLMKSIERDRAQWDKPRQLEIYRGLMKGGLRPHPFLQRIVNVTRAKLGSEEKGYMVIHARVEPDMTYQLARWGACKEAAVSNMTAIINMIYEKFPEPPVSTVLIQFNRADFEVEEKVKRRGDPIHDLLLNNFKEINQLVQQGMWGGKVRVVEAGSKMVEEAGNPFYARYSAVTGGIINLFLAIESNIFIGTEISTYSASAVNGRFYREQRENYFYHPDGLYWITPENRTKPYRFSCF